MSERWSLATRQARCMSHSHMIVQKRYRDSVSPDPPVESGLLAMVDGLYIVLEHAKRYDTLRARWTAILVAAVTSPKARDVQVCAHR